MVVASTSFHEAQLPYWLVLNRWPRLGPRRFLALLNEVGELSNCFNAQTPRSGFLQWCHHHGVGVVTPDWKAVERDLTWAQVPHHAILTCCDTFYPNLLKEIPSPPPLLFVKGRLACLNTRQIGFVGARRATSVGIRHARDFAGALVKQGFTITSGLALGIDGASHEGALDARGTTIAVLGNGLDSVYPGRHTLLADRIAEKGALVSEFPIGTPPRAPHFPQRNRLISGLSLGVLVVEAALKSGSLITARFALEQGREVFAIPGSIHAPLSKGCHELIRQGAKCAEEIAHIEEELGHWTKANDKESQLSASAGSVPSRVEPSTPAVSTKINREELRTLDQMEIGNLISIDTLAERTGLTIEVLSAMLVGLELEGWIETVPGGYMRREKVLSDA